MKPVSLYWHAKGHPRERFPELAPYLPEERYLLWQMYGVCLCGCGQQTKKRRPEREDCTEINYFCNGHANTLMAQHGLKKPAPRTYKQRQAARQANIDRCLTPTASQFILSMVREYIDEHHDGKITRFAAAIGTDHSTLSYNLRGVTRLSKKRAKQLLLAIGEQPHPSLG